MLYPIKILLSNKYLFNKRYLFYFLLIVLVRQYGFALKPSHLYSETPYQNCALSNVVVEDVTFITKDGITLTGWFFKPDTCTLKRPTVIVAGPDKGNMGDLLFYTNVLSNNINVLLFDYRGFGKSGTWPIDTTALIYPEFITDLEAALKYVKTRQDVDPTNLGLFGLSMGTILCFGVAARHPEIKVLVADGMVTSTTDIIAIQKAKKRFFYVPGGYPTNYEPITAIKDMQHCKVFIVAGDKDTNTPLWMAKKIYGLAPNKGELWVIKGAKHLEGPYAVEKKFYINKTNDYYSDLLRKWPVFK